MIAEEEKAKEILLKHQEDNNGDLTYWQEQWVVQAMLEHAKQEKENVEVELWRCTNNECQIEQTIDPQLCIHCGSEIKPIATQHKESKVRQCEHKMKPFGELTDVGSGYVCEKCGWII